MDVVKTVKTGLWAVLGVLSSWLGVLAIPVYVLVGCNVMDYITGLLAAHRRGQKISSYTGINGIAKKVCMWLLIAVGGVLDWLIGYAGAALGMTVPLPMAAAMLTAVWLIVNEVISILENVKDSGRSAAGLFGKTRGLGKKQNRFFKFSEMRLGAPPENGCRHD